MSLLAGHCYHVDGTLLVSGRTNLVIDGNGATLRAFSQGTRNRMFWKILSSSHVTIKDMTMWGPNTSGRYNAALEAQHGVSVNGSTDAVVSNITVRNVYGDGVQVTKAGDGSPAGSDRVTIRNSRFQTIGRQGITITKARNVTVDGNTFNDVARSVIDLEPPTDTWYAEHVTIENNVTGDYGNMFVAGGGHGCNMHDIVIRGNVSKGGGIAIGVPGDTCHKSGVLVENNTFHLMVGADKGHWANFWRVDDVTIRGNRILTSRTIPGVHFIESQGTLIVQGNTFSGTCTAVDADDSAPVQESDNTLSSSCP